MKDILLLKKKNYQHDLVLVIFGLLISFSGVTQVNLVPNSGFEQYNVCPGGSLSGCNNWYSSIATNYIFYSYGNTCSSSPFGGIPYNNATKSGRYTHSGNGYVCIITYDVGTNLRNYIQASLINNLIPNKNYYVEFYIAYATTYLFGANNLGLLFGDTAIVTNNRPFPVIPQILPFGNPVIRDTINWIKIAGIYKAHGGEKYITLGNFFSNTNTLIDTVTKPIRPYTNGSCYYIDDVSVIPLDSMFLKADAGRDTSIYKGDSVFIGSRSSGLTNVHWVDSLGNTLATNVPGLWVKPNSPSYYIITQNVGGQYSTDTVHIGVMQKLPVKFVKFSASIFNPSGDGGREQVALSWQTANEINVNSYLIEKSTDVKAFYRIGKLAAENKAQNSYAFTDENVSEGVTYYRILALDNDGKKTYSAIQRVENSKAQKPLFIYPNPANDLITIKASSLKSVTIINTEGKVVYSEKVTNNTATINISNLAKGVYLVKGIQENNTVVTEKLIKE